MSNRKAQIREQAAARFEIALQSAGMQRWTGKGDKPKYWRGRVDKQGMLDDLFLLYTITDNLELNAADNKSFRRNIYINGQIYTRSGYANGDFQDLQEKIQYAMEELNIVFTFQGEGVDTSIDQDAPVYYINFESEQRLLV